MAIGSPYSAMPSNPYVESQRPGWCVRDERNGLWLTEFPTPFSGIQWGAAKSAYVYESLSTAQRQASFLAGAVVTTVPRFNGHCQEWQCVS